MTKTESGNGFGKELARLIAGHICLHAAMAGTRMTAPLLALNQGYDKLHIGALVALFALTQIFLSLPVGRLTDRRGLKLVTGWSVVVASIGTGMAAIWPVYPVLCLSALLTGGAVGAATIAMQRHVGRLAHTGTQLKQVFSWLSIAPAIANFLGPFGAGVVIDHAGYRHAFVLLAALPVIAWLGIRSAREFPNEFERGSGSGTAWDLWREPGFRHLLLMNLFLTASWDAHGFIVPVLGHERGLSASVVGSILGAFAIAATIVRLVMPLVAARLREWTIISGAMATAGAFFAIYPFMHSPIGLGLCSAVIGMALGSIQPMIMSILHQITPSHRHGEAVAMRVMAFNISSVTMPMVFGAAGGLIGVSGLFWAMGLVVMLGSRWGRTLRTAGEGDADD